MLLLSAATEAAVSVILQPLGQVIAGVALRGLRARKGTGLAASPGSVVFSYVVHMCRAVVVRERGGAPFRQISLATGGTLTLKRSGSSANHVVLVRLTLGQFIFWPKLPPNAGFGIKNLKKNFRG